MSFLGCLLAGVLGLFVFVAVLFGGILRFIAHLLGLPTSSPHAQQRPQQARQQQASHQHTQHTATNAQPKEKIFERDNSEYVEFEEVRSSNPTK